MALTAVYERFLASPNPLSLSENASLHYIPTLTSYTQSGPVIRHLESQNKKVVKIKSQKVINAVEGPSSIALEVDTVLEFLSGGGAYLPNLENFVVDKIATIPLTHIVQFSQDQKISQIRISWDQASLLKQTEVIGSRGRNWPVVDGRDQVKLIASSVSNVPIASIPTSPTSPRGRGTNENGQAVRNASPNKKHVRDPHTSLDLFGPQKTEGGHSPSMSNPVVAPRAESFKPPPRDMSEIFAAGHEDNEPGSPKKAAAVPVVAPKGASNRKFGAVRLFQEEEEHESVSSPKIYKTNPARYNHFDLGETDEHDHFQYKSGSQAQTQPEVVPMRAKTNKHGSQWDFSDFTTPHKVPLKLRDQDKVHFGWGDENKPADDGQSSSQAPGQKPRRDAEANFEFKDDGTPVERKVVPKPRKDAQSHFEFEDQPTPAPAPARIIARTDAAKGLYQNVLDEDERPLSNISNNTGRKHDFGSHWQASDKSPANLKHEQRGSGGNHGQAIENMGSKWDNYEQSPEQPRKPTTSKAFKKGLELQWGIGVGEEQPTQTRAGQKGYWDF